MFTDGDGSLASEANRIAHQIHASPQPVVLIAHGPAIPAAIEASHQHAPRGLILSNGPIESIDRFTRGLIQWARLPRTLTETLMSPTRNLALLASSVGLRRLVVNPYVMDHDTIVTVCGPIFGSTDRLARVRFYLKSLANHSWKRPPNTLRILICQGDGGTVNSCNYESFIKSMAKGSESSPVPGGRYLHPIERPWELADRSITWAEKNLTTT
jgi:hypothetical protein